MDNIDFEKFELLTESEQLQVCAKWSGDDWFNYFASKGTITLEEFRTELKAAAHKIAKKKYGGNI